MAPRGSMTKRTKEALVDGLILLGFVTALLSVISGYYFMVNYWVFNK